MRGLRFDCAAPNEGISRPMLPLMHEQSKETGQGSTKITYSGERNVARRGWCGKMGSKGVDSRGRRWKTYLIRRGPGAQCFHHFMDC